MDLSLAISGSITGSAGPTINLGAMAGIGAFLSKQIICVKNTGFH